MYAKGELFFGEKTNASISKAQTLGGPLRFAFSPNFGWLPPKPWNKPMPRTLFEKKKKVG